MVVNPLAKKALAGEFKEGERVRVDVAKKGVQEELSFKRA